MLIAEVITPKSVPDWRKRGYIVEEKTISCEDCGLSYTDEHHKILHANKKLGYFFFASMQDPNKMFILCHQCLFKHIKTLSMGEETDLMILDEGNEYKCKFYPEDMAGYDEYDYPDLGSDGDDDDDFWSLFHKE